MPEAGSRPQQQVIEYFQRRESRWGYALLLDGSKHFGYYPPGSERIPMATAVRLMTDRLGQALGLPAGALVLDAGCGEGGVALHLATSLRLRAEGIDLQPQSVHRVLKPGGRLALFEYSLAPRQQLTARQREVFDTINRDAAMHSLPTFVHGSFPALLHAAGFEDVTVEDVTERMLPMLRRLARLGWAPYQLSRLLRMQRLAFNATAAVEAYRHRVWRYNVVTAAKPPGGQPPPS